mmetsp:Transcript_21341/g.73601  ORF Transcript_21341/g.73601 Transcript_21341/m.73601 type:complete len:314 (+) Transcript_21341:584-1525(+)
MPLRRVRHARRRSRPRRRDGHLRGPVRPRPRPPRRRRGAQLWLPRRPSAPRRRGERNALRPAALRRGRLCRRRLARRRCLRRARCRKQRDAADAAPRVHGGPLRGPRCLQPRHARAGAPRRSGVRSLRRRRQGPLFPHGLRCAGVAQRDDHRAVAQPPIRARAALGRRLLLLPPPAGAQPRPRRPRRRGRVRHTRVLAGVAANGEPVARARRNQRAPIDGPSTGAEAGPRASRGQFGTSGQWQRVAPTGRAHRDSRSPPLRSSGLLSPSRRVDLCGSLSDSARPRPARPRHASRKLPPSRKPPFEITQGMISP